MYPSAVAQRLLDSELRLVGTRFHIVSKGLLRVRRLIARRFDPPIEHAVGGISLLMPLSHMLPRYQTRHPTYGANLARVAAILAEQTGRRIKVVDIGANVGDTAALVCSEADASILCIEPDAEFRHYLEVNLQRIGGPAVIDHRLVEDERGSHAGHLERRAGTATYVTSDDDVRPPSARLEEIVGSSQLIEQPDLIKVDTDGMDVSILASNTHYLGGVKPVLFFEVDFNHPQVSEQSLRELLVALAEVGYVWAGVFSNIGLPIAEGVLTAESPEIVREVALLSASRGYADLLVAADEGQVSHLRDAWSWQRTPTAT